MHEDLIPSPFWSRTQRLSYRPPGVLDQMDTMLKNVIVSIIWNLHPGPVHFRDVLYQSMINLGFDEIERITGHMDLIRARSVSSFLSLRYLYCRLEYPTTQLTMGHLFRKQGGE